MTYIIFAVRLQSTEAVMGPWTSLAGAVRTTLLRVWGLGPRALESQSTCIQLVAAGYCRLAVTQVSVIELNYGCWCVLRTAE